MNAGMQKTMSDLHATHAARKSAGVGIRGGYSGGYSANVDPLDSYGRVAEAVSSAQITLISFDTHRPLRNGEHRHDVSERASWAYLMARTIIVARPMASVGVNEFSA